AGVPPPTAAMLHSAASRESIPLKPLLAHRPAARADVRDPEVKGGSRRPSRKRNNVAPAITTISGGGVHEAHRSSPRTVSPLVSCVPIPWCVGSVRCAQDAAGTGDLRNDLRNDLRDQPEAPGTDTWWWLPNLRELRDRGAAAFSAEYPRVPAPVPVGTWGGQQPAQDPGPPHRVQQPSCGQGSRKTRARSGFLFAAFSCGSRAARLGSGAACGARNTTVGREPLIKVSYVSGGRQVETVSRRRGDMSDQDVDDVAFLTGSPAPPGTLWEKESSSFHSKK
ncbi:hypothetical protein KUF71_016966, partial [Frankliniella fusca]